MGPLACREGMTEKVGLRPRLRLAFSSAVVSASKFSALWFERGVVLSMQFNMHIWGAFCKVEHRAGSSMFVREKQISMRIERTTIVESKACLVTWQGYSFQLRECLESNAGRTICLQLSGARVQV